MLDPLAFRHRSAAEQAAAALRKAISIGALSDPFPGEYQLAAQLGLSRPTLRQALAILAEEGLIAMAQGRRTQLLHPAAPPDSEGSLVICVISAMGRAPRTNLASPILDALHQSLGTSTAWEEVYDARLRSARFPKLLEPIVRARPRACWILIGSTPGVQRWFAESGLPALVLGSCFEGVDLPSIDLDYHAVGWHAAGELRRAGHRHTALVIPQRMLPGDEATSSGFKEYLAARDGGDATLWRMPEESLDAGCAALDRLLAGRNPPTAFFVLRPEQMLTIQTHLLRRGFRIPENLSLISRDSAPFLLHTTPEPARYESDPHARARRAAKITRALASGTLRKPWPTVRIMPVFYRGETVGVRS